MQQPKRFQAPTMAEAYDQVRRELGDQAVILSTRKAFAPGLFGQPGRQFVEVVARIPEGAPAPRAEQPTLEQDEAAHDLVRAIAEATAAAPISAPVSSGARMPASVDARAEARPQSQAVPQAKAQPEAPRETQPETRPEAQPVTPEAVPADGAFAGTQAAAATSDLPEAPARATRKRASTTRTASKRTTKKVANEAPTSSARKRKETSPEEATLPAEAASAPAPASIETPMLPAALEEPWGRQLDQMRTMLEQLLSDRGAQRIDETPAALRDMKERLARHGMARALVDSLMTEADARDEHSLESNVERRLAAKLPPTVSVLHRRQRAVFLVGPGGAGKTTLAVRMALDLQRQGLNVVIAGTDVNRAGAPQQLVAFGSVTGLDVRLCYAPGELDAILSEPNVDLVIVDTPGHNGLRRDRMAELSSFLQAARQRSVLLTVPATMKGSDLSELVSAFSSVVLDGVALTRCDETNHFGQLANVLIEAALGVALMTRSDQVGDAPVAGDNAALAEAMVRAQWPAPASSAPRIANTAARPLAKVG